MNQCDLPPLPPRPVDGHKGTFGTVLVIGGCCADQQVMIGAPALTANAALRTGCGLVKLAMPEPIIASGVVLAPSATAVSLPVNSSGAPAPSGSAEVIDQAIEASRVSVLAIGPGWGVGMEQQQILARLIADDQRPIVLDADGLNNLADVQDFSPDIQAPMVLTPHPGEYRRLAQALELDQVEVGRSDEERCEAAQRLAQRLGCVVVLKGAGTVVSNGIETWVCPIVNPALATAGTGDVLTGVIASLVAQFYRHGENRPTRELLDNSGCSATNRSASRRSHRLKTCATSTGGVSLLDCACWGVLVHGLAADHWSEDHGSAGLLASELADLIPDVIHELRGPSAEPDELARDG